MKIEVGEYGNIHLSRIFSPIVLEMAYGRKIAIAQRDGLFEITVYTDKPDPFKQFEYNVDGESLLRVIEKPHPEKKRVEAAVFSVTPKIKEMTRDEISLLLFGCTPE